MLTSYETGTQLEFPKKPRTKVNPLPKKKRLVPLSSQKPPAPPQVLGEIKPHNLDGVRDGINQLLRHFDKASASSITMPTKWVLVTYRPVWGKRDRIEALLANPDTITAAIKNAAPKPNAPKPTEKDKQDALIAQRVKQCISSMSDVQKPPDLKKLTWYLLGEVPGISLDQPIPLGKCATMVGQRAETPIRKLYENKFGVELVEKPSPSANGPDLSHEFATLLSELRDSDQSTYDRIIAQILRELDMTFSGPGDPQRAARRARLQALFARVPASRCRALYARLTRQGPQDPLFQHFHSRLSARSKVELLGTLRARSISPSSRPAAGAAAMRDR